MIMNELIGEVPETPAEAAAHWRRVRERIHSEFENPASAAKRPALLALNHALMNMAEKAIPAAELENFREIRGHSYAMLIVKECLDGEKIRPETANLVTRREVAIGRMVPNHSLRKLEEMAKFAAHIVHTQKLLQQYAQKPKGLARRAVAWLMS